MFRALALPFLPLLSLAAGCAQTIHPPRHLADPVRAYVADYGYHSSLLLPSDTEGKYVEYAFGDWSYMALGRSGVCDALSAIFVSPQAALGRRTLPVVEDAVAGDVPARPGRITRFNVERESARRLSKALDVRFGRGFDEAVSKDDGTTYVKDREHYWLGHNCNHVTRRWLRALGCDVRGWLVTSRFRVAARGPHPRPLPAYREREKTAGLPCAVTRSGTRRSWRRRRRPRRPGRGRGRR